MLQSVFSPAHYSHRSTRKLGFRVLILPLLGGVFLPREARSDEVVQLSAFEVTTTQGHGYVSTNAASGFKTNQPLLDIPQEDIVVTRDLINDLGYANTTDIVAYFGVADFQFGDGLATRGYKITYAYVDDLPENQGHEDNVFVDTYELIKGPAQVLYLNASLSGVALKSTRKPLPFEQNILTFQIDQWGTYRATLDSTGPIGTLGEAKISYRVVAADQDGHYYYDNFSDRRKVVFPVIQVDFKATTVRVNYLYERLNLWPAGQEFITPSGAIYTGWGRRVAGFPANDMTYQPENRFSLEINHRLSDNWQDRLSAGIWDFHNYGSNATPAGGYNWANQTVTYTNRLNNYHYQYWTILDDIQGNYLLGPIKNSDAVGFGWDEYTTDGESWTTAGFGNQTIPLGPAAAAALDAMVVPSWKQFSAPANEGTQNKVNVAAIYWQHNVELIPNWLILTGGWTWSDITTSSVANLSAIPWNAAVEPVQDYLYRYAAVFKATKEISLYAMESSSFNPPSQGAVLETGGLPPPQNGLGREVGLKTSFLGGRLSSEFAWFKLVTTNVLQVASVPLPNGLTYSIPVGTTLQEGVDGDAAFSIVPGWQVIGSFYAGHDRDQNGFPVSSSYDNQWGLYSRYDFSSQGSLHGLALGAGAVRIGGRWISTSGISGAVFTPYQALTQEIKLQPGTKLNGFASYGFGKHWLLRVSCNNILNQAYAIGLQTATNVDAAPPRTFTFETDYKF